MNSHVKFKHEGHENYKCQECNKAFATLNSLKTHKSSVHDGIRYPCEFCKKEFSQKVNLRTHLKNVHKQQKIPKIKVKIEKPRTLPLPLLPLPDNFESNVDESLDSKEELHEELNIDNGYELGNETPPDYPKDEAFEEKYEIEEEEVIQNVETTEFHSDFT